jgi:hypothetical protein
VGLIRFHRVLIGSAIVFCAGFGAWQLISYAQDGGTADLVLGFAFAAAAGLLLVYLLHLRRILRLRPDDERVPAGRPRPLG